MLYECWLYVPANQHLMSTQVQYATSKNFHFSMAFPSNFHSFENFTKMERERDLHCSRGRLGILASLIFRFLSHTAVKIAWIFYFPQLGKFYESWFFEIETYKLAGLNRQELYGKLEIVSAVCPCELCQAVFALFYYVLPIFHSVIAYLLQNLLEKSFYTSVEKIQDFWVWLYFNSF